MSFKKNSTHTCNVAGRFSVKLTEAIPWIYANRPLRLYNRLWFYFPLQGDYLQGGTSWHRHRRGQTTHRHPHDNPLPCSALHFRSCRVTRRRASFSREFMNSWMDVFYVGTHMLGCVTYKFRSTDTHTERDTDIDSLSLSLSLSLSRPPPPPTPLSLSLSHTHTHNSSTHQ